MKSDIQYPKGIQCPAYISRGCTTGDHIHAPYLRHMEERRHIGELLDRVQSGTARPARVCHAHRTDGLRPCN